MKSILELATTALQLVVAGMAFASARRAKRQPRRREDDR